MRRGGLYHLYDSFEPAGQPAWDLWKGASLVSLKGIGLRFAKRVGLGFSDHMVLSAML